MEAKNRIPTIQRDGYEWNLIKIDRRYEKLNWKEKGREVDVSPHQITEVLAK